MLHIGDKIRVNKGLTETLIKVEVPYGLFKSRKYQVVRKLSMIKDSEIVKKQLVMKKSTLALIDKKVYLWFLKEQMQEARRQSYTPKK